MPMFVSSEPSTILASLAEALDRVDIGIVLLSSDLHVQLINRRFTEVWQGPSNLLSSGITFQALLEYTAATTQYSIPADELQAYLDEREASVRAQAVSTTEIDLRDGRRLLFRSSPCIGDGRILTYVDITPLRHERELLDEVREAAQRMTVEQRFNAETLEAQAAHLVSLAEAADAHARRADEANRRWEQEMAERQQLEAELRRLATTDALTGILNRAVHVDVPTDFRASAPAWPSNYGFDARYRLLQAD